MAIEMKPVDSTSIQEFGYDKFTQTLRVRFKSGLYEYTGVPEDVAKDFEAAPSKGTFLQHNIRSAYPAKKVEEEEVEAVHGDK